MTSPVTDKPTTLQLLELGQSVWLDNIQRSMLTSGSLKKMIASGWVTGMTSNPSIFEKAIANSDDYAEAIASLAHRDDDLTPYDAFVSIAVDDIRGAADALRPVYDRSNREDGYISLELPPGLEDTTEASVREAKRLFALVDRPNVMIKVPGTKAGTRAVSDMIFAGINTNITLLFAYQAYEDTIEAYLTGLERRIAAGKPLEGVASVASFFVSRVDSAVDKLLPEGSPLRGTAGVANARHAYRRFREVLESHRWRQLAKQGAHVQRTLWASTSTKDPSYSDVKYVEELIGPDTVNTMPEKTLQAALDHLDVRPTLMPNLDLADSQLEELGKAGIDLNAVTAKLLDDGLESFAKDFAKLLQVVASRIALVQVERKKETAALAGVSAAVESRLREMDSSDLVGRIWKRDHTVWKPDPTEIANRLDWLTVADDLADQAKALTEFAKSVWDEGYTTAVLLGMGGSSLAPEVLQTTFGTVPGALTLHVLDATDPDQIAALEAGLDLEHTLFIVSSKSGTTIETLSQFAHFWSKVPDGAHFIAVTDPGTSLQKLAEERVFRRVFANPPDIGGRYSALSYFGLVPAALIGVDVAVLLKRAHQMMEACGQSGSAEANPGAWLGAILGEAALAGRNKLTLVLPEAMASLANWIEQLIAESTGKEGRGILPVAGEPPGAPAVYGKDRLFVVYGDDPSLQALEKAGHPVVRLAYHDPYQLGAEFFRWEFATAVAGHILQINAFDQPNVQEAKEATNKILAGQKVDSSTPPVDQVLGEVKEGDYIALTAYVPRNDEWERRLQRVRVALRDRYHVATTIGFGPRFLHSTGQMHKGGPNQGVFLQVVSQPEVDLPIPGETKTFGELKSAQADGDLESLRAHGRRVARMTPAELEALA
ncbi:MAG: bifunctional transaldolase/phosoglucose isomerase [Tepidiformaceae bacterium]